MPRVPGRVRIYTSLEKLRRDFPAELKLVEAENDSVGFERSPRFVAAAHGQYVTPGIDGPYSDDLVILYDVGDQKNYLFAHLFPRIGGHVFINKYVRTPRANALRQLSHVAHKELPPELTVLLVHEM